MSDRSLPDTEEADRNPELEEVIANYIRTCETSATPNRRQLLERYPEFANELRQFFAQSDRMNQLVVPIRGFADDLFLAVGPGRQVGYVGNYELLEEIARGGMGIVYKAHQVTLGRIVAVKMIVAGRLATDDDVKRFRVEAQAAAGLHHPHIVSIHEVGQHEGWNYFSMDYVEGRDLAAILREKLLPAKQAATYVRQMAEAIHYAHQQGTLHRDLKPSNILIDSHDQVRITDFGLAMRVEDDSDLTRTGQIVGTPSYMPPEQARGQRNLVGPGSDVYALGAVLYECLTGRPPFRAGSVIDTIQQVIHTEPASPRLLNPAVPRDLETICRKCLEKEPHRRYGTAQLLADDLGHFLRGEPIQARPISQLNRIGRWCRRNPTVASLGSLAALLICAVTIISTMAYYRESGLRTTVEIKSNALALALDQEKVLTAAESQAKTEALGAEKNERLQRTVAEAEKIRANEQTGLAQQRSKELSRRLYLAQMNLAGNSTLDPRGTARVLELTDPWRPQSGDQDLRGWEWYYLDAFCRSDRLTLLGHTSHAWSVAWNSGGTRLASGSWDHTARIWEPATGTILLVLQGHHDAVMSVAWNPQANQLATASWDCTIKIWDGETGEEVRSLVGHAKRVNSAAWSPDGKQIVSASADHKLKIWDAATGRETNTLEGHDAEVVCVAWSPDGQWIASGGRDGVVKIWDASTGIAQKTLRGEGYEVLCVAWNPDGTRLASGGGDARNCRIWDVETGQQLHQFVGHLYEVYSIDWSPDGTQLVTACRDKAIRIWDAASGQQTAMFHGHSRGVIAARWSPNGQEIASASQDQTVKLWNLEAGAEKRTFRGHAGAVLSVSWAPDGRKLATASEDHSVRVWDAVTRRLIQSLEGHSQSVRTVVWSPDGTRLASAGDDKVINVWDASTGERIRTLAGHTAKIESVAWSPDSSQIASVGHDQLLNIWNAETGETICSLRYLARTLRIAWSPDGRRLALTLETERARVLDTTTWQELLQLADHVRGVTWSPDGTQLATCDSLGVVKIWNSQTGAELFVLRGHATWCNCVAWSPDGSRLASTSEDGTTKIWDTSDGSLALTLPGFGHWFFSVAWSPDGLSLATTSYDHNLTVWRAENAYERDRSPIILPTLNRRLAADPCDIRTLGTRADVVEKLKQADSAKADRRAARAIAEQRLREQPYDEAIAYEFAGVLEDELERNSSVRWQVLAPVEAKSTGGATLTTLADRSVLASGTNPDHELYTVVLGTNLKKIAALRLELIPHPSLPAGGSGRATNGNWGLAELTVAKKPRQGIGNNTAVPFSSSFANIVGSGGRSIQRALDEDPGTYWTPFPDQASRHQVCVQFANIVDGTTERLEITMNTGIDGWRAHTLGHFQFSVTTDPEAVFIERLRHLGTAHTACPWCRVGTALFLTGDYAAAAEYLEKAVLQRGHGDGLELILLALAHQHLEHVREAERWCDSALEWFTRNPSEEAITELAGVMIQRVRGMASPEANRVLGELITKQQLKDVADGVATNPPDASFYQRRAKLFADAGEWESATADYNYAIDLLPPNRRWAYPQSALLGEIIRTQPAVFEALLKLRKDARLLLLCRGRLMAMKKDWKNAADDYTRAAEPHSPGEEFFEQAAVRLLAGDVEGYRTFMRALDQKHGETNDPFLAFVLARSAALASESPVELPQIIKWAEKAVAHDMQPWYLHTSGLAFYRAQRYDEAAERLEQSLAAKWNSEGTALNHLALGLTRFRQGRLDESRQYVEKARAWAATLKPNAEGSLSVIPTDWMEYHILQREVEAAINTGSLP